MTRAMTRAMTCVLPSLVASVALGGVLAPFPASAGAAPGGDLARQVLAARLEAGVVPERGLSTLQALRAQAQALQRLDVRLAVDEAECRIQSDLDNAAALSVAQAGLAAAPASPAPPVREPWLRLRICRAGVLIEQGQAEAGHAELEAVLKLTGAPDDRLVHALARLQRGVQASRTGRWDQAQQDLLQACEALRAGGNLPDRDLCDGHLAIHFQRVGDSDESLRLYQRLLSSAQARGATFDASIYAYGIGQVQADRKAWALALTSYQAALEASRLLGDAVGVGYAEAAMATTRLRQGEPVLALAHVERGLAVLDPHADPRQHEAMVVSRGVILQALGRTAEALSVLAGIEARVRQRGEEHTLGEWLRARMQALKAQGRWQEAFDTVAELRQLELRLYEQRASRQAALVRMQFNRARDAEDLSALRRLNEQGQRLRQTQAIALVLFLALLAVVVAVAARKVQQVRQLHRLASTDELTGLANRRSLMAFADDQIARVQRAPSGASPELAVLMIDIDHFKHINDTHGHAIGDEVLRHTARVLAGCLRERDFLGRIGGEEFVAVLPGTSAAQARQVADRMRSAIEAARIAPGAEPGTDPLSLTVSIGVAWVRAGLQPRDTASSLLERADSALYRAKRGGRNAVASDEDEGAVLTG